MAAEKHCGREANARKRCKDSRIPAAAETDIEQRG